MPRNLLSKDNATVMIRHMKIEKNFRFLAVFFYA